MADASRRRSKSPPKKQPNEEGVMTYVRYTPEIAGEICERLGRGEIWGQICNSGRMPSYATLYNWKRKHPEFAEQLAQSREMLADMHADRALLVAENTTPETLQCDRLRFSALQWRAERGAPRKYGSKADDGAGEPPRLVVEVRRFEKAYHEDGRAYVRELAREAPAEDDGPADE